jgi:hypothetical protein
MNRTVIGIVREITRMLLHPRNIADDELQRNLPKILDKSMLSNKNIYYKYSLTYVSVCIIAYCHEYTVNPHHCNINYSRIAWQTLSHSIVSGFFQVKIISD